MRRKLPRTGAARALAAMIAAAAAGSCMFLIDDELGTAGEGVLQAAGLEGEKETAQAEGARDEAAGKAWEQRSWVERYTDYRAEQKAKRTPGVWVIYFSLAALPIFGLGLSGLAILRRRLKT